MHPDPRALREWADPLQKLHAHVHGTAGSPSWIAHHHVPATRLASLHPHQGERRSASRVGSRRAAAVYFDSAHTGCHVGGQYLYFIPRGNGPGPRGAGHHRARSGNTERPVYRHAEQVPGGSLDRPAGRSQQTLPDIVQPLPGFDRHRQGSLP